MQFSKDERWEFTASTEMVVGNGTSTLFWDRWLDRRSITELVPAVVELISPHARKHRTVQDVPVH